MQCQTKIVALAVVLASISQLAVAVDSACPELTAERICNLTEAGFQFYDGCNTVTCGENGNDAITFKACTSMDEDQCSELQMEIYERLADGLECPMLTVSDVCKTAPAGFNFTDGCNNFTCDGEGSGQGTERACPGKSDLTHVQLAICESLKDMTFEQLEGNQCEVNTTEICLRNKDGFSFSDGCNRITCVGSEGMAASTMMACSPIAEDSEECRLVQENIVAAESNQSSTPEPTPEPTPESTPESTPEPTPTQYTCRRLSSELVCKDFEFSYFDGCNKVNCMVNNNNAAAVTLVFCPSDDDNNADSVKYCEKAEATMKLKLEERTNV